MLTDEQKQEIVDGIDSEGFGYYFVHYSHQWENIPSEIQDLVIDMRASYQALERKIGSWRIYPQ